MELNSKKKMGPEDRARIEKAIEELASWDLPPVWINEPDCSDDGDRIGPSVSYLWLEQNGLVDEVESEDLPEHCQMELWEETMHVLAAREGLVTVRKNLPGDEFTDAEVQMMGSVRNPSCIIEEGYYHGVVGSEGSSPRSDQEWVQEGTVVVFDFPPDEYFPYPSVIFYRFVTKDELTLDHLPHIEGFLSHAENGPSDGYSVRTRYREAAGGERDS
jgi:hypothetical protein